MNDEPSTPPASHPIMIRPMARRQAPPPRPAGPKLTGRDLHFAQVAAMPPKPPKLSRAARRLAKRIAPDVRAEILAGRRRRKG